MRHLLIIEGPDCVGKTTLAKYLAKALSNAIYVRCNSAMKGEHAESHFDNILETAKFNIANGYTVVIDRLWPSEYLYAPLCGRPEFTACNSLDKKVKKLGGIYVLCQRSDVLKQHALHQDPDHPYDPALFKQIVDAYEVFKDSMIDREDVIVYNYDTMASQLHLMREMVEGID